MNPNAIRIETRQIIDLLITILLPENTALK
jgi:hypothetical protein